MDEARLTPNSDGFLQSGGALRGPLWQDLSDKLAARDGVASGDRLGPYAIVKEIGHGGMGAVYLAERQDGQFEQRVALKLLEHDTTRASVVQRFEQERRILAALNHPGIARLFDGGATSDGRPYFVMEYVDGMPIDRYCDDRRLTVDQRLRLFTKVGEAVQHAHRNLVVHRDLKPSNILVTANGEVKLLDFGIAKVLDAGVAHASAAHTNTRVMTPAYASPEQLRGETVTTASDIYQLGLLLYELLTGRRPYGRYERTPHELERAISETAPLPPSTAVTGGDTSRDRRTGPVADGEGSFPEIASRRGGTTPERLRRRLSGDLDTMVLMALRKEPERRYATVAQMTEDVLRHLSGLPVRARPDTLGYRTSKFVRRHARAVAGVAAALILVVGIAGYYTTRLAVARDRARLEAEKAAQVSQILTGACPVPGPEGHAASTPDPS
ncbi:MAG: serine/threonine-protein kinase, partial [Vicinamibacteraceae bacterium]